jgi:hypothetical protein
MRFSHSELKSLVLELLQERKELQRTIAAPRDEIARAASLQCALTSNRWVWSQRMGALPQAG